MQLLFHHVFPPHHLCDGSTDKSYPSPTFPFKLNERVVQTATNGVVLELLMFRLLAHNKIDYRLRIFKTMRMVVASRFYYQFHISTQCQVTFTHHHHVLLNRYTPVAVSTNTDNGHTRFGQRFQIVYGIAVKTINGFFRQVPFFQQSFPCCLMQSLQASEHITEWCIKIKASNVIRVLRSPNDRIESSTAKPFHYYFRRKPVILHHFLVETVTQFNSPRTGIIICNIQISHVETSFQQGFIHSRKRIEESRTPYPRITGSSFLRHNNNSVPSLEFKIITVSFMPFAFRNTVFYFPLNGS